MKAFLNFLPVIVFLTCISAQAQSPPGINYQGVARDLEGKPLVLKNITIKISILKDNGNGVVEFAETHAIKTNSFGLFTLVIGNGEVLTGSFDFISWALGNKWLQVEMDPDGGNYYHLMGTQQFMSVPYAFYSLYSGNGLTAGSGISIANSTINNTGDADNNPTNEIQDLNLTGNSLKITNNTGATSINMAPYLDNTDSQTLSVSGSLLRISNGNTVDLSALNTDTQALAMAGSTLSISGGNTVDLSQVNTDNQSLGSASSGTTRTISISNGTGVTIDVADNDNNSTNEIQDLSLTSNVLKVTNNLTATDIDLSPYLDNTDGQGLMLNPITNALGISGNPSTVNLAGYLDNTDDQDLTLDGLTHSLTLTNDGTAVSLLPYLDNTDAQQLSTGTVNANTRSISITGGNTSNIDVRDADADATNEIQDLSTTAMGTTRTINISGGTGVTFDVADNDNSVTNEIQDLSLNTGTNTLTITNNASATNISLAPYLDNTDNQVLGKAGATISLVGGGSVTLNDDSSSNEIQDLSLNTGTNTLTITNNATATNISLASYLDNTDAQTLGYSSGTKSLNITGGNSVTIPETQNLNLVLAQGTDAGAQKITNLGAPANSNDATTKQYVDDADAVLASRIATTYAFKTAFAYTNSTPLIVNGQVIPFTTETFDDFNVLGGNSFTAVENGIYAFVVDGSYSALIAGGQLSLLFNGVEYPVALVQPWGGSGARFNATMLFKLFVGQTVSLVGDNVLVGGTFTGSFSGYKL